MFSCATDNKHTYKFSIYSASAAKPFDLYRWLIVPCLLLSISYAPVLAQEAFDLIMLETKPGGLGLQVIPGSAQQLTNRDGYDNQPYFLNSKQIVFTSQAKNGKSDIIMYSFDSKKFTNMSRTDLESEYSPSLTACGKYVAAVRVEEDGKQRLWLYPINFGEPEVLYDDLSPVGYYAWSGDIAALSIVGEELNKLVFPYAKSDIQPIAFDVGRSIQTRPKTGQVGFIDQSLPSSNEKGIYYTLKAYDPKNRTIESLGPTLPGSEDFIWLDKNRVIMAKGKNLYIRNVRKKDDWRQFAAVSVPGYGDITRMAISPKKDKLILVMDRLRNP